VQPLRLIPESAGIKGKQEQDSAIPHDSDAHTEAKVLSGIRLTHKHKVLAVRGPYNVGVQCCFLRPIYDQGFS
jgi:hypothetical protein